jgi:UDP-N-acetylmuramate dehydrogenase
MSLATALAAIAPTREGEVLARHTTIGIGGPADVYVMPESTAQLVEVLRLSHDAGAPVFMLGSGSNIVIGDRGMRGVTIESKAQALTEPKAFRNGEERFLFRADGGCSFAAVSRQLSFAGYKGLEWACGIPGTIGGAVVYNAGAYGGCLGDVLLRVGIWSADEGEHVYEAGELSLVYRGSDFTRGLMAGKAVLWAEFALWPGDATELRSRIADYDERRLKAQPRGRNAGSFFKNPPEQPAWKLIDGVGMRGYQIGGAQFSEKHCNFLINAGGATAADVAALKTEAQRRVREQYGIALENEVTLVGEGFGD